MEGTCANQDPSEQGRANKQHRGSMFGNNWGVVPKDIKITLETGNKEKPNHTKPNTGGTIPKQPKQPGWRREVWGWEHRRTDFWLHCSILTMHVWRDHDLLTFNAVSKCGEQEKGKRRNGSRTRGYWKLEKKKNRTRRGGGGREEEGEEEEEEKMKGRRRERREFRERREHRNLELLQMPAAPIKECCARNLFRKTVDVQSHLHSK